METNKIQEQANPVMDTARMTLSYLAKAGIKEAEDYAKEFGFIDYGKTNYHNEESSDAEKARIVMQEARFNFLNNLIRKQDCKNILDIACGFSPRGLMFAREGYNYVGVDLQAAINVLAPVSEKISKEEKLAGSFKYHMADITNPEALSKIADEFDGKVTVVCEGLFMYLGPYEVEAFIKGLKSLLVKNGGVFITPDFVSSAAFRAIMVAMLGKEEAMKAFEMSRAAVSSKSDTDMSKTLMGINDDAAYDFFTQRDIEIQRVPYFADDTDLISRNIISPEQYSGTKTALQHINGWIASYKGTTEKANLSESGFSSDVKVDGKTLNIKLSGRLDSISAPDFISSFENIINSSSIDEVNIDMDKLEYTSSAGLRGLLIIKKKITGDITVVNANKLVLDIFSQTGFDSILKIK